MLFARWVLRLPKIFANVQRIYQITPPEMLICLKNIILSKKKFTFVKNVLANGSLFVLYFSGKVYENVTFLYARCFLGVFRPIRCCMLFGVFYMLLSQD